MKNKLFLGCVIPARLPFIESSARKVFEKLNLDVSHLENASCCPDPTGIPALDHKTWLALGARNLSLVGNGDSQLISLCSGCIETLKTVQHFVNKDAKVEEEVNRILSKINRKYNGNITIKHAAQVLHENLDNIKNNIKKPLENFKVGVHYGCHCLRPSEIIEFDDPFEPTRLDEIVVELGAESLEYEEKMECCGSPVAKADEKLSNEILYRKLKSMKENGVNCIAVVCPACFLQLDFGQRAINTAYNTDFNFPVFYLTELIALSFGIDPKELGLKFHGIKATKFFEQVNFTNNKA